MPPTKTWKLWEKQLGDWWNGVRNPLSGRNNVSDKGKRRLGDVIVPELEEEKIPYLIEAKLLKNIATARRARETRDLALKNKVENWFHFERINGSNQTIILVTSPEWMGKIVHFLKEEMKKGESDTIGGEEI